MTMSLYLQVREKEGRLYSDDVVARLPFLPRDQPHADEWRARAASASRLTRYLSALNQSLTILELGCGNGWLSNQLSKVAQFTIGMDQNLHELKQGARVFSQNTKLEFMEADIFSAPFATESFNVIILASVIQYFPNVSALITALLKYVKPHGEIHIIDSPLYSEAELSEAIKRSQQYYASLGYPEMAECYFHHRLNDVEAYDAKLLYQPKTRSLRWKQVLSQDDSPFLWFVIPKQPPHVSSASVIEPRNEIIAEAFSRTAAKYDGFAEDHPGLTRMRNKVYEHVARFIPMGSHLLELNAGTGTDAVALAQRGYHVHATDIAPGMLERLPDKILTHGLQDRLTFEQRSFTELADMPGAPYDAIFSDLGGLNCVQDLTPVIEPLPKILRPGGWVTWVLMPPVCLWEMAEIFRGHPRLAFRRFARQGTRAHLEGLNFNVYYFTPEKVLEWFGEDYECLAIEGLSVLTPTAESKNFAKRYPRPFHTLSWLDDRVASHYPWRGWGDFFILTMRYQPQ